MPSLKFEVPISPASLSPTSKVGYSCQVLLAHTIRQHYEPTKKAHYYAWFATEINPQSVDLTSRPLHIYEDLDIAVKLRSTGHPKVKDLRTKLQIAVDYNVSDPREKGKLKARIAFADMSWFRPVLVKIDLDGVDLNQCKANAIMKGATPGKDKDECLSDGLVDSSKCWLIVE